MEILPQPREASFQRGQTRPGDCEAAGGRVRTADMLLIQVWLKESLDWFYEKGAENSGGRCKKNVVARITPPHKEAGGRCVLAASQLV